MNSSMKWVDEVRGTDSLREVARRIGTTHSTLARQINMDALTFETVREVSRAYGRSVIADLIATSLLTAEDAGVAGIERALHAASDEQLVLEIGRRLDVGPASLLWDAPASSAVEQAATVHYPNFAQEPIDELAVASPQGDDDGSDEHYDD